MPFYNSYIPRSRIAQDSLVAFDLPFALWLQPGKINLGNSETAGTFYRQGNNERYILGEETATETEVSVMHHQIVLPHNYVSGGAVSVRLMSAYTGGPCSAATIDCEVYKAGDDLTLGSDLCATAAQALVASTYTNKDFSVTPTGLVAGDVLNVKVTTSLTEGSGNAARAVISKSYFLCDVKG